MMNTLSLFKRKHHSTLWIHTYSITKKPKGYTQGITHPPFLRKANTKPCSIYFELKTFQNPEKYGQSHDLPRSHLVYSKVIKARNCLSL